MDFRRPWPFALFLLLAHVLSRILAVAAHEVLGHAAAALLLGGTAYGLYVSPGTGFTYVYLPRSLPPAGVIAMQGAGIAVNVAIGLALWWRTRRSPSFAWRAFGLVAAVVFIVYGLVYMAAGAFDFFPGDTWAIVSVLGTPAMAWGFLAVGTVWTLLVGVFASLDLLKLLRGPGVDLKREMTMLLLFWLLPAPLAFLPGFAASNLLGTSGVVYVAVFAAVLVVTAALLVYADAMPRPRPRAEEEPRPAWRPVAAMAVPILLFVPLWIGVFGLTPDTATGVVLEAPPVEAEEAWIGAFAVNLEVTVHADFTVTLRWLLRGTFQPRSPLEAQIASSYDRRMNAQLYESFALTVVGDAMNDSRWSIVGRSAFIAPNETVWSAGLRYPDARVVVLGFAGGDARAFLQDLGGGLRVLTVHDPFKFEPVVPSPGWLDALEVRWDAPLYPDRYAASGGTARYDPSVDSVRWQPFNRYEAHETYQVYLRSA